MHLKEVLFGNSELTFAPGALQPISEWVRKPNPRYAEVMFMGVGRNRIVDKVYTPPYTDFSPNSKMYRYDKETISAADPAEFDLILQKIKNESKLNNILFFGHLHPPIPV